MNKRFLTVALFFTALLLLSGCADNVRYDLVANYPKVGFWHGLWHGMSFPVSFIISLFSDNTSVYAAYNSGGWYDYGFLIGVGAFCGSSGSRISKRG